jgi:hypothetical protein
MKGFITTMSMISEMRILKGFNVCNRIYPRSSDAEGIER